VLLNGTRFEQPAGRLANKSRAAQAKIKAF
jgi:hypothetical protein